MKKKGFTFVEGIVVVVLVAIISLAFSTYLGKYFDSWLMLSQRKNLAGSSRFALNRLVRELKQIKGFTTFTATELRFTDLNNLAITFRQSGEALMRDSDILLADLDQPGGLSFTYLDSLGSVTASSLEINAIRVRLVTKQGKEKFIVESSARIRNLE